MRGVSRERVLALSSGRCVPAVDAVPPEIDPCTDTRLLSPGQVFVALVGASFDGHDFVERARELGAAAAIVARESALPAGFPGIVVADTTAAYLACAEVARSMFTGRVAAVTGSVGKTTTKEFLRALCEAAGLGPVLGTPANENNEIGVGHLLLRALRSDGGGSGRPATLVVEMGARHVGEIASLARAARPGVGVLTGVGESHLENFPSLEALRETKWGLFDFGARPVLNADDAASMARLEGVLDRLPILCSAPLPPTEPSLVAFAPSPESAAAKVEVSREDPEIVVVRYREPGGASAPCTVVRERFLVRGWHHRLDLALALGGVAALGGDLQAAIAALPQLTLPEGRYQAISLPNGATAVYDAYNAAPASTEAALVTFAGQRARRRFAVIASMAELGPDAERMHRSIGAFAGRLAESGALDHVLFGGDFAHALEEGALASGAPRARIGRFADNAEATEWLRGNLHPGDAVLLKGSRRYKLEEILEGLRR